MVPPSYSFRPRDGNPPCQQYGTLAGTTLLLSLLPQTVVDNYFVLFTKLKKDYIWQVVTKIMITPQNIPFFRNVLLPTLNFIWFQSPFFQNWSLIILNNRWYWKKASHSNPKQWFLYLLIFSCLTLTKLLVKHSKMFGLFPSSGLSKFSFGGSLLSHLSLYHSYPSEVQKWCTAHSCGVVDASYSNSVLQITKGHDFMVPSKAQVIFACLETGVQYKW